MPPEKQQNIVLVGHSLGGRIAVKTIALLKNKNVSICKGVFLGAAIPDNAPEIAASLGATIEPCINIHNKNDYVLRHWYPFVEKLQNALGLFGYAKPFYGVQMLQDEVISDDSADPDLIDEYIRKMGHHNVMRYMQKLADVEKKHAASAYCCGPQITETAPSAWEVLEKCCSWRLEKQKNASMYRIVNAHDKTVFCGDEQKAKVLWKQYSAYYDTEDDKIQILHDHQPFKIIDVSWGWETLDSINGWRLERKKVIFRGMVYRIIDPKDFQRANGSEQKMRESFNHIKEQIDQLKK